MYCICSGFPCYSLRGILYLCFHKENEKKKKDSVGVVRRGIFLLKSVFLCSLCFWLKCSSFELDIAK
jgi:hypothetical protein